MQDDSFPSEPRITPDLQKENFSGKEYQARDLSVQNSVACNISAQGQAMIENSLVNVVAAGRDTTVTDSAVMRIAAGQEINIQYSMGGILIAEEQASIEKSRIGILHAKSGVILNDSSVLMTTRQALALGVSVGATFALLVEFFCYLRSRK